MLADFLSGPTIPILRYFSLHEPWPAGPLVIAAGVCMIALHLFLLLKGPTSLKGLLTFPRHWISGVILTAICVPWFALLLRYNVPFLWMQTYDSAVALLSLGLFFPIIFYMRNLLSVRSLGCLLLLLGAPILVAIRWEDVQWARWIVAAWVYSLVIIGIIFVLYPFRFRRWVVRFIEPDGFRKSLAGGGILVGVLLLVSGFALLG